MSGLRMPGGVTGYSDVPSDVAIALNPLLYSNSAVVGGANRCITARTIIPKSGFLRDFTAAANVVSGNVDIGVYDTGDTTATVRTRLGHSGSMACPATLTGGKPTIWWDPGAGAIPVKAGQQVEFAIGCDNNTASFFRSVVPQIAILPDAFWAVPGGVLPKLGATVVAGFPLPGTVAEASWLGNLSVPFIMARVSAT